MPLPSPAPGQVIHYSYLWREEYERGREEGVKDRPCAVILLSVDDEGDRVVTVLPITHTPPSDANLAVEIPYPVKRRLGLDDARSWVVLTEANRFVWPGPDLRIGQSGDATSILYGELPGNLLLQIRDKFLAAIKAQRVAVVGRSGIDG